jgi:DNA-binding winged helix-turn-helix (wHTH) protein/tetratricopeptide (TPR) repeat protein
MAIRPWTRTLSAATELARTVEFRLGPLTVQPSTRRIYCGDRFETIEPRVMRVLVALGEKPGRVLSRDELIELSWDGQLVTDNAITRVVSRLRHALDDLSQGSVSIETITKVGFRLIVDVAPAVGEPPLHTTAASPDVAVQGDGALTPPPNWTRRATWVGVTGTMASAAYFVWLRPSAHHVPDPRAVALYQNGQTIQKAGVLETLGEAIEAYKQAVSIDPRYADAWGALALSYRYPVVGPFVRLGDPQEVRVAARRALDLDPGNADARLALITLYSHYQRWQEREAQLRAFLRDNPDSSLGQTRLGWLLLEVGRIDDAVSMAEHAIGIDPKRQVAWLQLAYAYYYAGRDNEGDLAIQEARSRWPEAWRLYVNGFYLLLYGKRYNEALAYLRDTSRRPSLLPREMLEGWMHEADAFASGLGLAELKNKISPVAQPAALQIEAPQFAAPALALLGMVDEMFALFEGYFFGGVVKRTRVEPPGLLDLRPSYALFAPAVLSLRNDPRYASLLARTRLQDYWYKTGTQPDFRRR